MSKPVISHVMLDVSCANEFLDEMPDYCLVKLSPVYVAQLLKYMDHVSRLHRKDDQVYSLERWDYGTSYIRYDEKLETLCDIHGHHVSQVPKGEPILLSEDPQLPEGAFVRVECTTVQISHVEVWWTGYIKHTPDRVESMRLTKKVLRDIHRRFKQSRP